MRLTADRGFVLRASLLRLLLPQLCLFVFPQCFCVCLEQVRPVGVHAVRSRSSPFCAQRTEPTEAVTTETRARGEATAAVGGGSDE